MVCAPPLRNPKALRLPTRKATDSEKFKIVLSKCPSEEVSVWCAAIAEAKVTRLPMWEDSRRREEVKFF